MRSLLISPNQGQRAEFETAASSFRPNLIISRVLDSYPTVPELSRMIRAWAPEIVFLSLEVPQVAEYLSQSITKEFPGVLQVALHTSQEPELFRRVLHLKMSDLLTPPFDSPALEGVLLRADEELRLHPVKIGFTDRLFAFLPGKGGVGTSTIAANLSWALAKKPENKTLLMDLDFHSGVVEFLFNVQHQFSAGDAFARGKELDVESWERLVKNVGNIDLLLSGAPRVPEAISQGQLIEVLDFARRNYSVVNVDLPDVFDDVTLAVLREANRIFLTTTPELPSLRLTRLKVMTLGKLDLESKTQLLVNRVSRRSELNVEEIEKTVGLPVFASFGCEYNDVMEAATKARPSAKLAKSFEEFADRLLNKDAPTTKRRRFTERFAIVPMRYGFR